MKPPPARSLDQGLVDRRALEVLGERQLGDRELVLDRAGLLLVDLGVEQIADNALGREVTDAMRKRVLIR